MSTDPRFIVLGPRKPLTEAEGQGLIDDFEKSLVQARAGHPWVGSEDGHNCRDCAEGSAWRCDRPAHSALLTKETP
jgi:hypothetical protein